MDLWPDLWPAWALFLSLRTQWRVGANGPTGLDHTVLLARLDRLTQLTQAERDQLDADVQCLEIAALAEMNAPDGHPTDDEATPPEPT